MSKFDDCIGKGLDDIKLLHPTAIFAPCMYDGKHAIVIREADNSRTILDFDPKTQLVIGYHA